jgi:CubicO group peptidase (beta-lactamase class C family)
MFNKKMVFTSFVLFFHSFSISYALDFSSPKCQDFIGFSTLQKQDLRYISGSQEPLKPFMTDSIVVYKDGQKAFEWHDGVLDQNSTHVLWSASKMITATLLGRTIKDGAFYKGEKISLQTPISLFYPNPGLLKINPEQYESYKKITLEHLIDMSANFNWKESYDEDMTNSSFLPMLYGKGHQDMAEFALQQPLNPEGPGGRWVYSGGNMNILMSILEKIHQDKNFAHKILFDPLGFKNARIESDTNGARIGSSYVYLRTEDFAKLGQLFLQNGFWNGKQLLPNNWVAEASEITPAAYQLATSEDELLKLGVQSRRLFWLNQHLHREDGKHLDSIDGRKIIYRRDYPQAPYDLYFAAGHYGQVLIIIPSENVIIARTGYDLKYWDHIQPLVVKALSCLNPNYKPHEVADLTPPAASPKQSKWKETIGTIKMIPGLIKNLRYFKDEIVNQYLAKEMCSFLYVAGAAQNLKQKDYVSVYQFRSGLPSILQGLLMNDLYFDFDDQNKSVSIRRYINKSSSEYLNPKLRAPSIAVMDPDNTRGCKLLGL